MFFDKKDFLSKTPTYEEFIILVNQLQTRVSELEGSSSLLQEFRKFILDGIELKKKLDPGDYYGPVKERTELENRLKKLLASRLDENHKELVSFQKRMLKYKDYILTFLYHPKVPPDNNLSESTPEFNIQCAASHSRLQVKTPKGYYFSNGFTVLNDRIIIIHVVSGQAQ